MIAALAGTALWRIGTIVASVALVAVSIHAYMTSEQLEEEQTAHQECLKQVGALQQAYAQIQDAAERQNRLIEQMIKDQAIAEQEAGLLLAQARAARDTAERKARNLQAVIDSIPPDQRTCERATELVREELMRD